ncbi:UreD-domain-containing protein [Tothia fuscella]|uniref:UreD-domain-containing protein n=1 Tax=Tothia fuscella TaxID=1048955 RepID=A0A9P4TUS0_9PEZI|nr:UreD-domain-containing protein [Tothia fuscella]
MISPFAPSSSQPGHGKILLSLLPPSIPILQTCSYQYPLKLIAPHALTINNHIIYTVFLLTYGGGLVAGDALNLSIHLDPNTRLVLLTQGSTKIFKTPSRELVSRQYTRLFVDQGAGLCYIPDPVQPFKDSCFEQVQIFEVPEGGSICICDWVCQGRTARGENWHFYKYTSKNEVYLTDKETGKRRLLLRDNVLLEDGTTNDPLSYANRIDSLGVFGTLILRGPLFEKLGKYFMAEFAILPRIGARNWDGDVDDETDLVDVKRKRRQRQETKDGLLWTAASMRGFVLVKFGAKEVEGVKRWLGVMLRTEGSVETLFGEGSLLCLK